jgi:hypothetical protein
MLVQLTVTSSAVVGRQRQRGGQAETEEVVRQRQRRWAGRDRGGGQAETEEVGRQRQRGGQAETEEVVRQRQRRWAGRDRGGQAETEEKKKKKN